MANTTSKQMKQCFYFLCFLICIKGSAIASNTLLEKKFADQYKNGIEIGTLEKIKYGKGTFSAIFTPASRRPEHGAVLLLHGAGLHPNWPDIIMPLRTRLPDKGWATLSIQMPILERDAAITAYYSLFTEAAERISAGIGYLRNKELENVALVGHSLGALMALSYLAGREESGAFTVVTIGLIINQESASFDGLKLLEKVALPILDIYGGIDLPGVVKSAKMRRIAALRGKTAGYRQVVVPGANHVFSNLNPTLTSQVAGWISRQLH